MMQLFYNLSIWNTAFRPFFWAGSLIGVFSICLWLSILSGIVSSPVKINVIHWHSYEMVFGFTRAIVLGFLFTAVQNWTNSTILKGKSLILLFTFWLLGRFSFYPLGYFSQLSFVFDITADLIVLYLLYPKLTLPNQRHNLPILFHYLFFTLIHLISGLSFLTILSLDFGLPIIHLGIFSIVFLIQIIGGRVVPFFTGAVIQGYTIKRLSSIEFLLTYIPFVFYLSFFLYHIPSVFPIISIRDSIFRHKEIFLYLLAFLSFLLFILNFVRYLFWNPWVSYKRPILWILYIGYFWLCLGFLFYSFLPIASFLSISSVIHTFTIGAIGVFIYGMITRVSLGHTGRPLVVSNSVIFGYLTMNLAVIFRVFFPLTGNYEITYYGSGLLWMLSLSFFLIKYTGILFSKRPDGKLS